MTRSYLYNGAKFLMRERNRDSELGTWAARINERIGGKRAKVAVARKLAVVMAAVWKSGGDFVPYPNKAPSGGEPGTPMASQSTTLEFLVEPGSQLSS